MSKSKRTGKRHNPHKHQQMKVQANLDEIRKSSWFIGGSWNENIEGISGNFEYSDVYSPAVANLILSQKNQWSSILIAFFHNGYQLYTKAVQLDDIEQHVTAAEAEALIEPHIHSFKDKQDPRYLISMNWFFMPTIGMQLTDMLPDITDILEDQGAADRLLCELASEKRWEKIKARHAQEQQEAA